ncbi:hypothetical protein A9Q78_10815 [Methylophaga sp. 41_12_T18]|nr:hypothetical protein A9Q78_10815 [Methylophaga sp. 41_12_T18]
MVTEADEIKAVEIEPSVGKRLRLMRESKNFSVAEVAVQLRLTKDTILNLENQQWHKLHGRAYARGYFSSYTKLLGLPENELLAAFNVEYKLSEAELPPSPHSLNSANKKAFPWMAVIFLLLASLLTGFAYIQWQQSEDSDSDLIDENTQWQQSNENQQPEYDAFDASVVEPLSPTENLQQEQSNNASSTDEIEQSIGNDELSNLQVDVDGQALSVESVADEKPIVVALLELYPLQDCWVEVSDASDTVLLYKTIKANESVSLTGTAPLSVKLGSAASVTVKFNDALFDTTPFTSNGVASFTLEVKS